MEKVPVTVKFDQKQLEQLKATASSQERTVASMIRYAVSQYCKKESK